MKSTLPPRKRAACARCRGGGGGKGQNKDTLNFQQNPGFIYFGNFWYFLINATKVVKRDKQKENKVIPH